VPRQIPRYRVVIIASTFVVAAGVPVAAQILALPRAPEIGGVWTQFPSASSTETPTPPASETLVPLVRPLYQTAIALPLPPGTLMPDRFDGAFVETAGDLDRARSMVTIFVPGGTRGSYRASVQGWGDYSYPCTASKDTRRLYCIGSRLPPRVTLVLVLFEITPDRNEIPVFRSSFFIPAPTNAPSEGMVGGGGGQPSPTSTPSSTYTSTAVPSATPSHTYTPSPTATETLLPSPTDTPTLPPPTDTSTPPPSETPPPTNTPLPPAPTDTPAPPPSETPAP
jgi:hypothetical protein